MAPPLALPQILALLALGLTAGVASGLFGIGGGLIIVPALTFLFGVTQKTASATSLIALLLPVGILGAMEYHKRGILGWPQIQWGLLIAFGLFVGAFFGAKLGMSLQDQWLRKGFAVLLVWAAWRLWIQN